MSREWREPTEAEIEYALATELRLTRDPAKARERAIRYARAEAWQRDRGLVAPLVPADEKPSREDYARSVHARSELFRRVEAKPPDGVTYGKKGGTP